LTTASFFLYSHGVQLTIVKKYPCIVVNAKYHGSKALAHADVTIHFENEKTEFQVGKTDKNGNFCFYPDQTGTWIVTADDAMGHRTKGDVLIKNDFFEVLPKPSETEEEIKSTGNTQTQSLKTEENANLTQNDTCCYLLKIILGVLLILVLTFLLHLWKKRKDNKKDSKKDKK
jgi:hypothetical protein